MRESCCCRLAGIFFFFVFYLDFVALRQQQRSGTYVYAVVCQPYTCTYLAYLRQDLAPPRQPFPFFLTFLELRTMQKSRTCFTPSDNRQNTMGQCPRTLSHEVSHENVSSVNPPLYRLHRLGFPFGRVMSNRNQWKRVGVAGLSVLSI